uniref:F-box/FBD/LRR-repeat protein At1g13570-like isoform X2 n=1 Tax=Erigeron canadensis TaxID=72917 RepID=UPI001CB930A4|nr:F-box/FBD/LRR-repeat protein At1g13570-like isoform X2 [Erigeron canadensis]
MRRCCSVRGGCRRGPIGGPAGRRVHDKMGTSMLSKNWRFKWTTMLSQLVFDEDFFENLAESYHGRIIISRILLLHKHAITKFSINIEDEDYFEDIGNWVMFLSQKGIEEFALRNASAEVLILPTHLFSCQKLKHLRLEDCCFPLVSGSYGFPNLLSLKLFLVRDAGDKCGEFLKQSPLLEILEITGNSLEGLSILQLLGLFPKLRELTLDSSMCKVERMEDFSSGALPSSGVHPSIAGQLQLQKVVFKNLQDTENELRVITAILTCFPLLKKMDVFFEAHLEESNKFSKLQQAYPKVKIVLHED